MHKFRVLIPFMISDWVEVAQCVSLADAFTIAGNYPEYIVFDSEKGSEVIKVVGH